MTLSQAVLDELWDFGDATATEARLRTAAEAETDASARAELATQVARALGLQGRFAEAEAILSTTPVTSPASAVRVALERGRLRTSAGDPATAIGLFELAAEAAAAADLTFLRVDALHMLAIADAGRIDDAVAEFEKARDAAARWGTPQQVQWAEEALAEARAASGR